MTHFISRWRPALIYAATVAAGALSLAVCLMAPMYLAPAAF